MIICYSFLKKKKRKTNNKQQTTNNKQQTTNNKQQTTNNKQQPTQNIKRLSNRANTEPQFSASFTQQRHKQQQQQQQLTDHQPVYFNSADESFGSASLKSLYGVDVKEGFDFVY